MQPIAPHASLRPSRLRHPRLPLPGWRPAGTVLAWCVLCTAAAAPLLAQGRAQPTPAGEWRQFDDRKGDLRSIVRLELRDGEVVGTIVKAFLRPGEPDNPTCQKCPGEFAGKAIEGLRFMWGVKGAGTAWDGGRILDPESGRVYRVRLRLLEEGQTLEVRGYLGAPVFGRTQRWTRAVP
jgi:uncharacterized protein (DUF2147 family)